MAAYRMRDTPIFIRVTANEKSMIMEALDISHVSLSRWGRIVLLREAKKVLEEAGMQGKIIKAAQAAAPVAEQAPAAPAAEYPAQRKLRQTREALASAEAEAKAEEETLDAIAKLPPALAALARKGLVAQSVPLSRRPVGPSRMNSAEFRATKTNTLDSAHNGSDGRKTW